MLVKALDFVAGNTVFVPGFRFEQNFVHLRWNFLNLIFI